jgi:DNA-binding LacI/PurR family transcriptional regulator
MPTSDMTQRALEVAIHAIGRPSVAGVAVVIEPTLVVRRSTGPAPRRGA